MGILNRRTLYRTAILDGNMESDLLDTALVDLDLSTIQTFIVTEAYKHRIDLISYKVYKNFNLGWLIAVHNNIEDPIEEIVVGRRLNIPSLEEFYRFVNRNRRTKDNVR